MCSDFYEHIKQKFLKSHHRMQAITVCKQFKGLLPFCDPTNLLKRVRTFLLNNRSTIDLTCRDIYGDEIVAQQLFQSITDIRNSRVFSTKHIYQLDDKVALTLFNTSYIQDFHEVGSYEGVFVCILLFPMMSVFGDTS